MRKVIVLIFLAFSMSLNATDMKTCTKYLEIAQVHQKGMGANDNHEVINSAMKYRKALEMIIEQCDFPIAGMNEELKQKYIQINNLLTGIGM